MKLRSMGDIEDQLEVSLNNNNNFLYVLVQW